MGMLHLYMGMEESMLANFVEAKEIFEQGLKLFKGLGSSQLILVMRSEIGHAERHTGNLPEATTIYRETIRGWQELGNRAAVANQLECFGFLAIRAEQLERAARLFAAAEALRESCQSPMTDFESTEYNRGLAQLRDMLAQAEFKLAWAQGRKLLMDQAVQLALEQAGGNDQG
jgi:nitroreductase